jgi:putative ubiquitin-RnfH superfamily antitoxin RatB of RatAB toxin-antitoxin module
MKIEVFWCASDGSVQRVALDLEASQEISNTVGQAIALLPESLKQAVQSGALHLACFGQHRSLESPLLEGDRIELLGPVLLDVKAERSARVKAARARERGPYNRSFSGLAKPGRD